MLANPLSRADAEHVADMLNAASEIVRSADGMYRVGLIGEDMVETLMDVQGELGCWLAFFTDGEGFGWAKSDAVDEIKKVEHKACELLFHISCDAIAADKVISS
jgi:hypothetical protein